MQNPLLKLSMTHSSKPYGLLLLIVCLLFRFNGFSQQAYLQRPDIVAAFKSYPNSAHHKYVASVFDCDENKKLHEFTLLLTPNGFIQFGSNPKIVGRSNIENMLIDFNKKFAHLKQHIEKVYYDSPKEIVYAAVANYSFEDGRTTGPIPYMVHLTFDGNLVSEYRIYIDLSPFYKMAK